MSENRARNQLLDTVLADVTRTGLPLVTRIDEANATFGGVDAFLLAAQHRWYTAFYAHLDAVLEDPGNDAGESVARMWGSVAASHPALRALLDAYAERPALAAVDAQHRDRVRRDVGVDLATLPAVPGAVRAARCPVVTLWRQRRGLVRVTEVA